MIHHPGFYMCVTILHRVLCRFSSLYICAYDTLQFAAFSESLNVGDGCT